MDIKNICNKINKCKDNDSRSMDNDRKVGGEIYMDNKNIV